MLIARRRLAPGLLVIVLGLGAAGCSGEAGPVDDGSLSSLRAGAPAILADLDVTLVSLDAPAAAGPDDVVEALGQQRLTGEAYPLGTLGDVDAVALEPDRIAGLLGVVGNVEPSSGQGRFVVLSFDELESAVVFAAGEPQVFADAGLERSRTAYFSGNLVAYYAPGGSNDVTDRFRAALDALAGT